MLRVRARLQSCRKVQKIKGALQAAEKLNVLKGHDFSRAVTAAKSTGPLGPEG
jgi:hypothetical protein